MISYRINALRRIDRGRLFLLSFCCLLQTAVFAMPYPPPGECDSCGSSSGGGLGFGSMLDQEFAGLRYLNQRYASRDGIFSNSPWLTEEFHSMQLWTKFPVGTRWQVSAIIPYHSNQRHRATGIERIEGLGDITALAFYSVLRRKNDSTAVSHNLQLGGGVKAPTGSYRSANNAGSVNPSFQLGTGSWDYLLVADYTVRKRKWGFNAMGNYVFKTENAQAYRFGDQFNYGGTLFYSAEGNGFRMVPQAGVSGEIYAANRQYGQTLPDTAGDILFGKLGIEAGKDRFSVGVNVLLPIAQDLTGGRVEARYRWSVNLNYVL